jgi:signal transduction histidine kinase
VSYTQVRMDRVVLWARELPVKALDRAAALAVVVLAVAGTAAQGSLRGYRPVDWLAYVLAGAGGLVLAERRRRPVVVFAAATAAAVVYEARGYRGGPALIAVVIAVYSVASLQTRSRSLALTVAAGVALSVTRQLFTSESAGSTAGNAVGFLGAGLFLGWAVANRRAFVAEIRKRAELAERTREEEARRQVDAERLRIARELHDVVAHTISTINVQAGVGEHVIHSRPDEAAKALVQIKHTSRDALRELRAMLDVLRSVDEADERAPAPGISELDALVATSNQAGVPTKLDRSGAVVPVPATVQVTAYRIVQEALTNVLRHAAPANASVTLAYATDGLTVTVLDDGSGANGAFIDGGGHGITGMRERAAAVGGTLTAQRRPQSGFEVIAVLPFSEAAAR